MKLIHAWECRYDPTEQLKNPKFEEGNWTAITPDWSPAWFQGDINNLPLMYPHVRFVVGACGTKFGKTYGCCLRLIKEAWENPGSVNWWIAPINEQARNAYNFILSLLPKELCKEHKSILKIEILNPDGSHRSWIEFKSGEKPGSLRGFGVNFFVIDEAVYFDYESFVSVVTTTTQTGGRGIIISTPKGRTWFYDVYNRGRKDLLLPGQTDDWEEWMSICLPTWVNPTVPIKNILQAKKNLPEDVFRQEYAAQFLSDGAGVFRNVQGCVKAGPTPETASPLKRYVVGVDLAKLKDYTVIVIIDVTDGRNHVVYFDRFRADWQVTTTRIIEISKRYNHARTLVDSTGVGDPILEDLRAAGLNVEGYKISGPVAKQQLIEKLRIAVEQAKVTFPQINVLIQEMQDYEYEINSKGVASYSAPPGKHDDCVIGMALAWMLADQPPFIYHALHVRGI
jgi:hypothetical protein